MSASLRRHARIPLAIVLAAFLAGCVMIPYRPQAETAHDRAEIANRESLRLSVGPRVFLDDMAKAVAKADQRVQRVDGQTFIDTASPTGELTLARLQDAATLDLIKPLQLDFVVLFAEPVDKVIDEKGFMFFYIGFFGLAKAKGSTTYWTAVLDARTLTLIEQLKSESVGTDVGVGYGYGLFVVSDTGGSARKDVVRHIVETMAAAKPTGPVRVAFLAVEPIAAPPAAPEPETPAPRGPQWMGDPLWAVERYPTFAAAAPPPEGQALVYFYRPPGNRLAYLAMDLETGARPGAVVSRIYQGGYHPMYVPAGNLVVRARWWASAKKPPAAMTLHVDAGATYYLRGSTQESFWHGVVPTLSLIGADQATAELEASHLMPSARDHDLEAERRAELGSLRAQRHVLELRETGVTYADGSSLPPDYPAAYKWALITKDDAARKKLAAKLTPEQIAEVERQVAEWMGQPTGAGAE